MTVMETLNNVFRKVFNDDEIQLRPEMTANDIEGWDSMSHVNLILAVENAFKIRFKTHEVIKFKNVGDLAKNIETKITT
jgi:acyl carrier protein